MVENKFLKRNLFRLSEEEFLMVISGIIEYLRIEFQCDIDYLGSEFIRHHFSLMYDVCESF